MVYGCETWSLSSGDSHSFAIYINIFNFFSSTLPEPDWIHPRIFGLPFVKRFALCYRSIVCLSVCDVGVLWPEI